jgi:hypothetical protein
MVAVVLAAEHTFSPDPLTGYNISRVNPLEISSPTIVEYRLKSVFIYHGLRAFLGSE